MNRLQILARAGDSPRQAIRRNRIAPRDWLLAIFALLIAITGAFAGENDFDLSWHTIDCGGGVSVGGGFELSGTIGQHDAGDMAAGEFTVVGGFWSGAGELDADPAPTCPADLNKDESVGVPDLLILIGSWGPCESCTADFDASGAVGVPDLISLLSAWGPCM